MIVFIIFKASCLLVYGVRDRETSSSCRVTVVVDKSLAGVGVCAASFPSGRQGTLNISCTRDLSLQGHWGPLMYVVPALLSLSATLKTLNRRCWPSLPLGMSGILNVSCGGGLSHSGLHRPQNCGHQASLVQGPGHQVWFWKITVETQQRPVMY